MPLRRALLWAAAVTFLSWEALAALLWLRDAGGLGPAADGTWDRLRGDWMLLILLTDHLVVALTALVWVWRDAAGRGWSIGRRGAWAAAFVALGSPALLGYLAERPAGVSVPGSR